MIRFLAILILAQIGLKASDPNLQLWLTFNDTNYVTDGLVYDRSGNENNGIRFNFEYDWMVPTNTGAHGTYAAGFNTNFTMVNGASTYWCSQYLAVTNLTGIDQMTQSTISFWAKFNHKQLQGITYLLDAGYNLSQAKGGRSVATNGFRIGRLTLPTQNRVSMNIFQATTTSSDGDQVNYWPADTVNGTTDTTTEALHLYTITIDCVAGETTTYYDGVFYRTTSITFPWIRIYAYPDPWLCIGANHHDGTYAWGGDDIFPNDAYHYGWLDDIRIYDRVLTAEEVEGLYTESLPLRKIVNNAVSIGNAEIK